MSKINHTSTGSILVLFILLVIVACSCVSRPHVAKVAAVSPNQCFTPNQSFVSPSVTPNQSFVSPSFTPNQSFTPNPLY